MTKVKNEKRLVELDVLRGLSIFGMILVITPGDWSHRFEWMNHAGWRGYPLADMIFPSFLFCVGMSMAISFDKRKHQDINKSKTILKVVKRAALLVVIGLLVNGFPFYDFQNLRIPGILQRIGLCYLVVAGIWIFLTSKKTKCPELWLGVCSGLVLIFYYILLYHIPVPNIGIAGDNSFNSWPVTIDQKIFGINHLWAYGTTNGEVTYDPEGILAAFPASVNVLFGLITGVLYKRNEQYATKLLFCLGICLLLFGIALDYFNVMPSIKKIWTSSFTLLSGGFSLILLVCIRYLLVFFPKAENSLYPFIVYGSNAILAFVISNLLLPIFDLPFISNESIRKVGYDFINRMVPNKQLSSFLFSLVFLILLFALLRVLYKKKAFLKI